MRHSLLPFGNPAKSNSACRGRSTPVGFATPARAECALSVEFLQSRRPSNLTGVGSFLSAALDCQMQTRLSSEAFQNMAQKAVPRRQERY